MKNEREIARADMVSREHQWEREAREHFERFAPNVNPDDLTADRSPNKEAFDLVTNKLKPDPLICARGIYLYGPSGSGKTSAAIAWAWEETALTRIVCCARLLEKLEAGEIGPEELPRWVHSEYCADKCQLWVASELKDAFADVARDREAKKDLIWDLTNAELLLIDDLGHTLSPPFAENLRVLLDRWQTGCLIITSQYSLPGLVRRWSHAEGTRGVTMGEQAEALVRRIKDICAVVKFSNRCADSRNAQPIPTAATQETDRSTVKEAP
jgi:DNA replication protein DnaC